MDRALEAQRVERHTQQLPLQGGGAGRQHAPQERQPHQLERQPAPPLAPQPAQRQAELQRLQRLQVLQQQEAVLTLQLQQLIAQQEADALALARRQQQQLLQRGGMPQGLAPQGLAQQGVAPAPVMPPPQGLIPQQLLMQGPGAWQPLSAGLDQGALMLSMQGLAMVP